MVGEWQETDADAGAVSKAMPALQLERECGARPSSDDAPLSLAISRSVSASAPCQVGSNILTWTNAERCPLPKKKLDKWTDVHTP